MSVSTAYDALPHSPDFQSEEQRLEKESRDSFEGPGQARRVYRWHIFSVAIHLLLVLLHLVLISVMKRGIEKRVLIELGPQTTFWGTAIQVILQASAIIFLAASLFVNQKLFMRRMLLARQTLTRTHDQFESWLGLGGAVNTLAKQFGNVPSASVWSSILLIALYFAASAVLKTSTSALFQLSTINNPSNTTVNATTPLSFLPGDLEKLFNAGSERYVFGYDQGTNPLQSHLMQTLLLQRDDTIKANSTFLSSIGLQGNTIYDVIPVVGNGTGSVKVNSYSIHARCYSVPDTFYSSSNNSLSYSLSLIGREVSDYGLINKTDLIIPIMSFLNITDSDGNHGKQMPLSGLRFAKQNGGVLDDDWAVNGDIMVSFGEPSQTEIFSSTSRSIAPQPFSCTDSLVLNDPDIYGGAPAFLTGAQLLFCSIEMQSEVGLVDTQARTLVANPPRRTSSSWTEFPWSPDEMLWSNISLTGSSIRGASWKRALKNAWNMGIAHWSSNAQVNYECNKTMVNPGPNPWPSSMTMGPWRSSLFEGAMFRWLKAGFLPVNASGLGDEVYLNLSAIHLHDLENAIEDYVSIYLFSDYKAKEVYTDGADPKGPNMQTSYLVQVNELISQLTLRDVPVYLGLFAATAMLMIALWIVITTPLYVSSIDELGVLQLIWLSDPSVLPVQPPSNDKLRSAGMETVVKLESGIHGENATPGD